MPSAKVSGITPSDQRKRKQSYTTEPKAEPHPQKTISELFATSKQGLKNRELHDLPVSSPQKRVKHGHSTDLAVSLSAMEPVPTEKDMYKFSTSNSRRASKVIDLTSPNGSPTKKKINGGRPTNITRHGGPRRLVVKNLKNVPRPNPDEYFHNVWERLEAALSAIFADEKLPYSNEELYRGVEIVCRQGRADPLNRKLQTACKENISSRVTDSMLQTANTESTVEILQDVVRAWLRWNKQLEKIRSIFFYLDRSYLLHSSSEPSIEEMGTSQFRDSVFESQNLDSKVLKGTCELISAERSGDEAARNENLLRDAIKMFYSLAVYTEFFEPGLILHSEHYFLSWAEKAVSTYDLAGYVENCVKLIEQELSRCDAFGLEQTTKKALESYLEDILVDQQETRLLKTEDVGGILGQDRPTAMSQLYSLLQRRRLGEKLRPAFEDFIVKQGSEIVFDEEREQEMVTRLLEFKKKLDAIWEHSFQRHEGLGHSLREAFETFINKTKRSNMTWGTDNPKPGEMIAKYVDKVLKGGTKAIRTSGAVSAIISKAPDLEDQEGESDDEDVQIGKQLDQVLDLFRLVHGKVVFEAFYKRDLARRLLLGRSASSDAEKSMLTRLKSGRSITSIVSSYGC